MVHADPDRGPPVPAPPSQWVVRHLPLLPAGGRILDLACGGGRHARHLLARGYRVVAVDRDLSGMRDLDDPRLRMLQADLEDGSPWPLAGQRFDGVVVTNYLHRPLLATLVNSVAAGGALLYETFARGNERWGRPARPEFLLRPGELLEAVRGRLRVVAYEDVTVSEPKPACVQRIAAVAETDSRGDEA